MSAFQVRSLMLAMSLITAGLLFWLLPFSPVINAAVALAVAMAIGTVSDVMFDARATREEKIRDLRDRTDNPPS